MMIVTLTDNSITCVECGDEFMKGNSFVGEYCLDCRKLADEYDI